MFKNILEAQPVFFNQQRSRYPLQVLVTAGGAKAVARVTPGFPLLSGLKIFSVYFQAAFLVHLYKKNHLFSAQICHLSLFKKNHFTMRH